MVNNNRFGMLEHPEIGWIERTGYPSWMQENDSDWDEEYDRDEYPEEDYLLDRCYECKGYGDDYYTDENGELVSACDDCSFNGCNDIDE